MVKVFFRIKKLRINDYDSLIKFWNDAKLPYRPKGRDSRKELRCQLKLPYINFLVADKSGKVIGSICGSHDGRRGWINRLAVLPEYQRKGVARRLVKEVEKWFHKSDIWITCSLIEDWNKTSINFIQRIGYKKHTDILYFSKRKNNQI